MSSIQRSLPVRRMGGSRGHWCGIGRAGLVLVETREVRSRVQSLGIPPAHRRLAHASVDGAYRERRSLVDRVTRTRGRDQSPLRPLHLLLHLATMLECDNVPTDHSNGGLVSYLLVNQ